MTWLRVMTLRIRELFAKRRLDAELDDELQSHLEMLAEENMQRGMPAEEARRAARIALGGMEQVKEAVRDQRGLPFLESLVADVRFALRMLRKTPGFTAVAVLTLALGIGANTAIFSLIDAVMIRMLPVREPRELVQVVHPETEPQPQGFDVFSQFVSDNAWEALRDRQDIFSGIFAWSERNFELGEARDASGALVSGDYFNTLGVHPAMGRLLTTNDDFRGCPGAAVLSYGFWQDRYGGDVNAVGSVIRLDNHPFQIVGVSAPGFFGVDAASKLDVAVPLCSEAIFDGSSSWLGHSDFYLLRIIGRLKPGVSVGQASARLGSLSPSIFSVSSAPQNWTGDALREFLATRLQGQPSAKGVSWVRDTYAQSLQILMAVVVWYRCCSLPVRTSAAFC
jgi:putative ABC transport system permease protein